MGTLKLTTTEMRAFEIVVDNTKKATKEQERQIKAIRRVMLSNYMETCNCCDLEFFPLLTVNGIAPCPDCDHEVYEKYRGES